MPSSFQVALLSSVALSEPWSRGVWEVTPWSVSWWLSPCLQTGSGRVCFQSECSKSCVFGALKFLAQWWDLGWQLFSHLYFQAPVPDPVGKCTIWVSGAVMERCKRKTEWRKKEQMEAFLSLLLGSSIVCLIGQKATRLYSAFLIAHTLSLGD